MAIAATPAGLVEVPVGQPITIAIRHVGVDEAHFSYRAWESSDGYVDFAILTDEPFTTSLTPTGCHLVTT